MSKVSYTISYLSTTGPVWKVKVEAIFFTVYLMNPTALFFEFKRI